MRQEWQLAESPTRQALRFDTTEKKTAGNSAQVFKTGDIAGMCVSRLSSCLLRASHQRDAWTLVNSLQYCRAHLEEASDESAPASTCCGVRQWTSARSTLGAMMPTRINSTMHDRKIW